MFEILTNGLAFYGDFRQKIIIIQLFMATNYL